MLKLAWKYMRYYKSQTLAILISMILTAALLSGIASLMYSSRLSDLENAKVIHGDWHYLVGVKEEAAQSVNSGKQGSGFSLEQCAKVQIKDVIQEPLAVYFIHADETYRRMMHREIVEGEEPKEKNEIAADRYTLGNLGFSGEVGDTLTLNEKEYRLTGITKGKWDADEMEIFVGEDYEGEKAQNLLYLKFDEDVKLYKQLDAFLKAYKLSSDSVEANDEVTEYLSGEKPESIYEILKFALTDERGNFTYIVLKLQSGYHLAYRGMIGILCLFSLFVVYSIFNISMSKRTAEYAVMQTLGISEGRIAGTSILELWTLFLAGYPLGCLLGNGILRMCYRHLQGVFAGEAAASGSEGGLSMTDRIFAQEGVEGTGFHADWRAALAGFLFLLAALALIGVLTVYSMQKQTIREALSGDISITKGRRRIYSLGKYDLTNAVVRKFMFSNKKKVVGMLLSLSLGGCIFLCTTYMVENLKVHAQMSMKSDEGLGSDYKISVKSNSLGDTIPEQTVQEIQKMPELSGVYAAKFVLGEVSIREEELEWEDYFDQMNKEELFRQRYGGICVEKKNGGYGIKYDVYGYDIGMIEQLEDFVLEGEIKADDLEKGNQVIAVANKDGQGNYNFYGKHPGDQITLRVPKDLNCPPKVLKFQSSEENYVEREYEIAAIVSRALTQEEGYLNVEPWDNAQSLIMTNRQMSAQYGIKDYSFVNLSLAGDGKTDTVDSQLLQKLQDVPKTVLQNYSAQIETQKEYFSQQQLFFSGIAVILLAISLFHIMNSMNYSILARKREYGILRAMGITDGGLYRMILKTGILYGLLADVWIILLYHLLLRRVMDYYMMHVVQFLHLKSEVPAGILLMILLLNLAIAVAAVIIPAGRIVRGNMIEQMK